MSGQKIGSTTAPPCVVHDVRYIGLYLLAELAALVAAASWFGFFPTLLLLVVGGVLGMALVRREGIRAGLALAEAVRARRAPHVEVTDSALVGLAGLLILVPGVLSDVLGLLLVLPPTRALVRNRLIARAEQHAPGLGTSRIRDGHIVVDGYLVDGSAANGAVPPVRPWVWDEPAPRQRSLEP